MAGCTYWSESNFAVIIGIDGKYRGIVGIAQH